MDLNYAIFRSEPIYTILDLAQIGSHNKREKKAYNSNPDIKLELTKNNIELVPLTEKYVKGFYNITKEYRKEHEERMKTERDDRKKTFNQMLNKSQNVVADELLFTATHEFFKDMSRKDIKKWADTCMEFVYQDLGYTKEQVLHAVVHLDEKTPHIHCVVVPLVKKYDKRTNTERYTISKKQYIKDKIQLSELQDKYHKRLTENGFDLERGIKGSDAKNVKIKEYKKLTGILNQELNRRNERIDSLMSDLEDKMKSNKNTLIGKDYVKVKKDTFDTMNKVIGEAKRIKDLQPKLEQVFKEVDTYANYYRKLEKSNQSLEKQIKVLTTKNHNLTEENKKLKERIKNILNQVKHFFRDLLRFGTELIKDRTSAEIKGYFSHQELNKDDVYQIAVGTTKEEELFDFCWIPKRKIENNIKYENNNHKKSKNQDNELSL